MAKTHPRLKARLRRKMRIRKSISGTADRPRMTVFRSARHIYVQLIDDVEGRTLASASSLVTEDASGNVAQAAEVGKSIAEKAVAAGITTVAFDRNGFLYHGRVKALADAAREAGLTF
jgi:large subunit ribosomal protein L18